MIKSIRAFTDICYKQCAYITPDEYLM